MKIAHVCRSAWPRTGGMEAAVGGLAQGLAARGHVVRIVSLRDPGREAPIPNVEVVRLPRLGPKRYPTGWGLLAAVRDADVVHVHGVDGLLDQLTARRRAVPGRIGLSTHGGYFHTARDRLWKALWVRTVTRRSLRALDRVWYTSEADREVFAPAGVPGSVVPFGIVDRGAVDRAPEPGLAVVLGRVDVHKGIDDLIDALPHAPAVRVEVVGPEERPGLVAALRARASARGVSERVRFLGPVDDAGWRAAMGRAERLVLPSRYEGFGLAALEGMAAGVPVVLSDIPAFRVHAEHAPIVRFADPIAAAQALVAPIDPARVARARQVAETYRWPARLAAWEAEYARLVSR